MELYFDIDLSRFIHLKKITICNNGCYFYEKIKIKLPHEIEEIELTEDYEIENIDELIHLKTLKTV